MGRNVFWAKGLWMFRPKSMGRYIYGRIACGAKCPYMGRNVLTPYKMASGKQLH